MFGPTACFRRDTRRVTLRVRLRGFTIIELMVVVSLLAIVLSLAIPSMRNFTIGQSAKTTAFSLIGAAVYARSEAIKRNADVVVTANGGNWQNGWSISTSAGGVVLSQQEAVPSGVAITATATQYTYQSSGRLATAAGNFQISGTLPAHARCISFDLSGLPKSRQGTC